MHVLLKTSDLFSLILYQWKKHLIAMVINGVDNQIQKRFGGIFLFYLFFSD